MPCPASSALNFVSRPISRAFAVSCTCCSFVELLTAPTRDICASKSIAVLSGAASVMPTAAVDMTFPKCWPRLSRLSLSACRARDRASVRRFKVSS